MGMIRILKIKSLFWEANQDFGKSKSLFLICISNQFDLNDFDYLKWKSKWYYSNKPANK